MTVHPLSNGTLPRWEHHAWEEALEIFLAVAIILETSITYHLLGREEFFASRWLKLDFVVRSVSFVSLAYGVAHLHSEGNTVLENAVKKWCSRDN